MTKKVVPHPAVRTGPSPPIIVIVVDSDVDVEFLAISSSSAQNHAYLERDLSRPPLGGDLPRERDLERPPLGGLLPPRGLLSL